MGAIPLLGIPVLFLVIPLFVIVFLVGGGVVMAVPALLIGVALLVPLVIGGMFISLIVTTLRRTSDHHQGRRTELHQLQTDLTDLKKELQQVKEYLADLTIQLDDQRYR